METEIAISIGSRCRIPCEWTRDGTLTGRIVSLDDKSACVAVEREFLPNQIYHELFWVSPADVTQD